MASDFRERVQGVEVEADDDGEGGTFLRISFQMTRTDQLEWDEVKPLVRAIEDNLATVDERFPSVRFAEAA
jgi:hypothetical protein